MHVAYYQGADKSLARPGRKLQRPKFNFCKPLKKNSEGCLSNWVSVAAMTSVSNEKLRPFNCFFSQVGLRTYQHPCTNLQAPSATTWKHNAYGCLSNVVCISKYILVFWVYIVWYGSWVQMLETYTLVPSSKQYFYAWRHDTGHHSNPSPFMYR